MRIDAQQAGDSRITPRTDLERLKPRIAAPLTFVEQAEEQNDRGVQLVRQCHLRRLPAGRHLPACRPLTALVAWPSGQVHEHPVELLPLQQSPPVQAPQRLPGVDMQCHIQLGHGQSRLGTLDEVTAGVLQGAEARKPGPTVGPQAVGVEAAQRAQGVVLAPVGITGQVRQFREFAEHGHSDRRSQRLHQVVEGADPLGFQQAFQGGGVVGRGSHSVTVAFLVHQMTNVTFPGRLEKRVGRIRKRRIINEYGGYPGFLVSMTGRTIVL